jgi:hypothetical protein
MDTQILQRYSTADCAHAHTGLLPLVHVVKYCTLWCYVHIDVHHVTTLWHAALRVYTACSYRYTAHTYTFALLTLVLPIL